MPKIAFLFLSDFTKWGKNGFLFFAGFFNSPFVLRSPFKVRHRPGCRRISPAPPCHHSRISTAAGACPDCPTQVYHNGHIIQIPTQIIVYIIWVLFAQKLLTNTLMGITIDTYRTRAHPAASQSNPGTLPHQPTGQRGKYTTSGSLWQEIRP